METLTEEEMVALLDASMACWRLTWDSRGDVFADSDKRDQAWESMTLDQARWRGHTQYLRYQGPV